MAPRDTIKLWIRGVLNIIEKKIKFCEKGKLLQFFQFQKYFYQSNAIKVKWF